MNTCYYIIYDEEGEIATIPDPCGGESEYSYDFFYEENDWTVMKQVQVKDEYWVGYFFFNDMEGPEDACLVECNTTEHLDFHWESNNSSGHYECIRYEHRVNDDVIDTINHNFYDLYNE